jgi:sedoheptulokinase
MGVSTQMHGLMLVDSNGTALTPFFSWQSQLAVPHLGALPGMRPGYTVSLWHALHKSGQLPRGPYGISLLGEFVVSALTGRVSACHVTCAHGTAMLRREGGRWRWDDALLERLGLPFDALPTLSDVVAPAGFLQPHFGDALGLGAIAVHLAVGDQQASLLGSGLGSKSSGSINMGTGAQVARLLEAEHAPGPWELRPYFGGLTIATVTGLPGGAFLAKQRIGPRSEVYAAMAEAHGEAYGRLPAAPSTETTIHGAGSLLRGERDLLMAIGGALDRRVLFAPWDCEASVGAALAASSGV